MDRRELPPGAEGGTGRRPLARRVALYAVFGVVAVLVGAGVYIVLVVLGR